MPMRKLAIKINKNLTAIGVSVAAVLFAAGLIGQGSLNWYATHKATMFTSLAPAEIYNSKLERATDFKSGEGIVVRIQDYVDAEGCYAVYNQWLRGPVMYQFKSTRTAMVFDKPGKRDVKLFFELPNDLPVGHYHWMVTIFPTCKNYEMLPTETDTGAEFNIVK